MVPVVRRTLRASEGGMFSIPSTSSAVVESPTLSLVSLVNSALRTRKNSFRFSLHTRNRAPRLCPSKANTMNSTTPSKYECLINLAIAMIGFNPRPANVHSRCDAISAELNSLPDTDDLATEERRFSLMIERDIIYGIEFSTAFPGARASHGWNTLLAGVISIRLERNGCDHQIALDTADRIVKAVLASD